MSEQLFLFVQMEFPWQIGPTDGRYVLREKAGGEPEHVVILRTVGAVRRTRGRGRLARESRGDPRPTELPISEVTIIDPVSLTTEAQAQRWLDHSEHELESVKAAAVLRRVLAAHRIAGAEAHLHELSPTQAVVIRAGWGTGAQVADGRFSHARELTLSQSQSRGRTSVLRPQERLAILLGGREAALVCEELTLRARADFDFGHFRLAALELAHAYELGLLELKAEGRADLTARLGELEGLHGGVRAAADLVLKGTGDPDTESLGNALERLQAALRARTATGFDR
ncbi:MAG TPA: hypothetical protein VID48_06005 [Solirubrobacteraceae bacterium]